MITEALLNFFHALAVGAISLLSSMLPSPPGFWVDVTTYFTNLLGDVAAPIRAFLPLAPLMAAASVLVGLLILATFLKAVRMLLSLMTMGGGGVG